MKKHLILYGSGSRELSAVLRSVLGERLGWAGGYITEERPSGNDSDELDYYLCPACHAAGIEGTDGECFFSFSYSDTGKNTEVFRTLGKRLVTEALYYPYAVVDRFGGFELLIPEFRGALAELLSADIPLAGVILAEDEVEEFKNLYGLGGRLDLYLRQLRTSLGRDIDTELLDASGLSPEALKKKISQWADIYAEMP